MKTGRMMRTMCGHAAMRLAAVAVLSACCSLLAQATAVIERTAVPLELSEDGWRLERNYDFDDGGELTRKELGLSANMSHKTLKHVNGYNGDVVLRLSLPYAAVDLTVFAVIANYADDQPRHFRISYSFDGMNYSMLAEDRQGTGECELKATQRLPENRGLVFLKFDRVLAKDDANGRHGYVLWKNFSFALHGRCEEIASEKADNKSKLFKDVFPTGVFWPWERTMPCAEYARLELWDYVDRTMKLLADSGYDTLWFVNIGRDDMLKVLRHAEANGMKVLLNTDLLNTVYHGAQSIGEMEGLAWNTFKAIGGSEALLGYVVKDEPMLWETEDMSTYRDLMKEVDPSRDTIASCMNRQTLTYMRDSTLPVVCSDLYYFGSENSTQLATPDMSQPELSAALDTFCRAAERYGKHSWFMAQMFGDAWGRHWRKGDRLVIEPGTYLHWKMPTEAEARWQIWEALRLGCKGMFFYVLQPPIQLEVPPDEAKEEWQLKRIKAMDKLAETAAAWPGQELVQKRMEIDPGEGMTDMDGSPRPQMLATVPGMKLIRRFEQLLVRRRYSRVPFIYAGDGSTDTMSFVSDGRNIGVVVNRDLRSEHESKVLLPPNIRKLTDLSTGMELELSEPSGIFREASLRLPPGGGALLEAEFDGRPGIRILREDFARQTFLRVQLGMNAKVERVGNFGADDNFALGLRDAEADSTMPVCTLPRLTSGTNGNTVAMNLNRREKSGIMYCQVTGRLGTCRVFAMSQSASGAQANVMHLKNADDKDGGKSSGAQLIQDGDFFRPVEIPPGTEALEFYLGSTEDMISSVEIWFVPFKP